MENKNAMEQLMLLKATTIRTGAIHEAQALQLKVWPRMNKSIDKSEAQVSVDNRQVIFICESKSMRPTKAHKLFFENLENWVRTMLWDDTYVKVIVNGKTVFESKDDNEQSANQS